MSPSIPHSAVGVGFLLLPTPTITSQLLNKRTCPAEAQSLAHHQRSGGFATWKSKFQTGSVREPTPAAGLPDAGGSRTPRVPHVTPCDQKAVIPASQRVAGPPGARRSDAGQCATRSGKAWPRASGTEHGASWTRPSSRGTASRVGSPTHRCSDSRAPQSPEVLCAWQSPPTRAQPLVTPDAPSSQTDAGSPPPCTGNHVPPEWARL